MTGYKLIKVERTNSFLNNQEDHEPYTLTYLKKERKWYRKTERITEFTRQVDCPDALMVSWLDKINAKIKKGEWRQANNKPYTNI